MRSLRSWEFWSKEKLAVANTRVAGSTLKNASDRWFVNIPFFLQCQGPAPSAAPYKNPPQIMLILPTPSSQWARHSQSRLLHLPASHKLWADLLSIDSPAACTTPGFNNLRRQTLVPTSMLLSKLFNSNVVPQHVDIHLFFSRSTASAPPFSICNHPNPNPALRSFFRAMWRIWMIGLDAHASLWPLLRLWEQLMLAHIAGCSHWGYNLSTNIIGQTPLRPTLACSFLSKHRQSGVLPSGCQRALNWSYSFQFMRAHFSPPNGAYSGRWFFTATFSNPCERYVLPSMTSWAWSSASSRVWWLSPSRNISHKGSTGPLVACRPCRGLMRMRRH